MIELSNYISFNKYYKGVNDKFVITKYIGLDQHYRKLYKCKFVSTNTICIADEDSILSGNVKNIFYLIPRYYHPDMKDKSTIKTFFDCDFFRFLWKDMRRKVLSKKHKDWKLYGKNEYTITSKWNILEWFLIDLPNIQGYDEMIKNPHKEDYRVEPKQYYLITEESQKEFRVDNCILTNKHNVYEQPPCIMQFDNNASMENSAKESNILKIKAKVEDIK